MTSSDSDVRSELESERRPESESVSVSGSYQVSELESERRPESESGSDPGSESDHCSDLGSELGWDDEVESDYEFEPYQPNVKFQQIFTCYPMSDYKSPHLEAGDKIIMPPSALSRIVDLEMQYPLVFKVHSFNKEAIHYCGVLQFDAEEGCVHMPEWMMDNLNVLRGDKVAVSNAAALSKGVYMKLQPHASAFTELADPRSVLENTLREFTCVGRGSTIMVKHNQVDYYFDVLDVMPGDAITLTDTDCRVEFAPALDYVDPVKTQSNGGCLVWKVGRGEKVVEEEVKVFKPFTGNGRRLDGQVTAAPPAELPEPSKRKPGEYEAKGEFKPFTGKSRVLG
ncbi:hypothetical protein ACP275_05G142400 [Erythranthe tilingii]